MPEFIESALAYIARPRDDVPAPLEVPWTMKPVASAESGVEQLDDGRLRAWIRHDLLAGVSPAMLDWWFRHLEGDMLLEGVRVPRYRVWHPRDHVAFRYVRPPRPGKSAGAVFHIREVFGRDPRWSVDVRTDVLRLDTRGFTHRPRLFGLQLVRMDYRFARVAGGTRYENSLEFGFPRSIGSRSLTRRINTLLQGREFPAERAHAWIRHNVEEVGNFEHFLPALHAAEGS